MTNENHNFTWAIEQLKAGKKVRRPTWGKDSYWIIGEPDEKITWMNKKDAVIHINQVLANDWEIVSEPQCLYDRITYSKIDHKFDTLYVYDVNDSLNKIKSYVKNKANDRSRVCYYTTISEILEFIDKEIIGRSCNNDVWK